MKRLSTVLLIALLVGVLSMSAMAQQVTLTFVGWEASPLETASVKNGLARFMERYPNVKVEYTPVAGDYNSRLLTMIAGGTAPDVFFVGSRSYRDLVKRNALLDLTPYFDQEFELTDFVPSDREKMAVDGQIYGISSCIVVPQLYYNKDLFDEAGLPYPPSDPAEAWSWDEFVEVAKQLTVVEGNRTTQFGAYGFETLFQLSAMLFSNDGQLFSEDRTQPTFDDPKVMEVLQKVLELRTVHGAAPEARFLDQLGMNAAQMLQTGRVAMVADGSWALQQLSQMDFEVGVGVLPIFNRPVTTDIAHLHSAFRGTKHPQEAWDLIKFLSSPEYQNDLISSGLWMPNRMSGYTEEGVQEWINPEVHPEGFDKMIPFYSEYGETYPFLFMPQQVEQLAIDHLEYFWFDNQPLEQVVKRLNSEITRVLAQ